MIEGGRILFASGLSYAFCVSTNVAAFVDAQPFTEAVSTFSGVAAFYIYCYICFESKIAHHTYKEPLKILPHLEYQLRVNTSLEIIIWQSIIIMKEFVFSETAEFCIREDVSITCEDHEMIMITEAKYGRMSSGRCITREYGNIGCAVDVTSVVEGLCSGRTHCQSEVRRLMDIAQPCPRDLTAYLEVNYECMEGELSRTSVACGFKP